MAIVNRRMKVMHIISGDLWAGAEVQAYTLLKELHSAWELHVVLMNHGELSEKLLELGISITVLDESELTSFKILLELRKLMLIIVPDVIHTHRQKENILGGIANLISIRVPSVRTSHGAPEFAPKGLARVQVMIDHAVGRYLQSAIIAVSEGLAERLKRVFPGHKIHVIPNGINKDELERAASSQQRVFQDVNAIHVGIVGRLEPVKRVDIFLAAAALIKSRNLPCGVHFHIIGDGKLRLELEERCNALGLREVTTFHGHCQDIASYIYSLDILIMCSDHEGMPMTALEAVAVGTLLIAHSVGGLKEILSQHPDLLVIDNSPESYAQKIERFLPNAKTKKIRLQPQYQSSVNAQAVAELYESLCAAK